MRALLFSNACTTPCPTPVMRDSTWFMTDIFQVSVRSRRWLVKCLQYSHCRAVGPCPFGVSSRNRFTSRVQTCQSTAPKKLSSTISHLPSSFPKINCSTSISFRLSHRCGNWTDRIIVDPRYDKYDWRRPQIRNVLYEKPLIGVLVRLHCFHDSYA